MIRPVIWRCLCSGKQHSAALTGNMDDGFHVLATCGRGSNRVRPGEILNDGEITCPQCKTEESIAALVKYLAA
ncbi:MAG: hypothetical protein K8U57_35400 [Planctomycetes bacterium]|nr:hypothetical protein [Planctomycetota bacterium]